jgi:hypothetical protein
MQDQARFAPLPNSRFHTHNAATKPSYLRFDRQAVRLGKLGDEYDLFGFVEGLQKPLYEIEATNEQRRQAARNGRVRKSQERKRL